MRPPIEIFFSYAHEDEDLMNDVRRQLALFERQGLIVKWHDREIRPGADWNAEIDARLGSARIILLFVSPHFFDSDYAYGVEMAEALRRHDAGEARVIPIIARPSPWEKAPFASLQALPRDGRAITLWRNRDEASLDVARGIMRVVAEFGPSAASAATDRSSATDGGGPAKNEALAVRLEQLKRLLDESWYVFRAQQKRIKKLHALLEKRLGARVPADVGYDETFFQLYDELNAEEKEHFNIIRGITSGRMHELNGEIREWASQGLATRAPAGPSPATKRLQGKLDQLKLHLDLWFKRYEEVFARSDRRSIVFLDDLKVPGVRFPDELDDAVDALLAELRAMPETSPASRS